jgi:acyl-CoA synthetase (NDP forming)
MRNEECGDEFKKGVQIAWIVQAGFKDIWENERERFNEMPAVSKAGCDLLKWFLITTNNVFCRVFISLKKAWNNGTN